MAHKIPTKVRKVEQVMGLLMWSLSQVLRPESVNAERSFNDLK